MNRNLMRFTCFAGETSFLYAPTELPNPAQKMNWNTFRIMLFAMLAARPVIATALPVTETRTAGQIQAIEIQGVVEIKAVGATNWTPAQAGQILQPAEHLRTGLDSRVSLRWFNQSVITFGALTELEILPATQPDAQSGLHLIRGILSFFHRDRPGHIQIITSGAVAGVEGTEFALAVDETERTTLAVVDGKVRLANDQGSLVLTNDEEAVVDLGQAPMRTAGFIANNLLQWCFYYPAVLDPADLTFSTDEHSDLDKSLADYRDGDLLAALRDYPTNLTATTDAGRVYHAALLLAVGQAAKSEAILAELSATNSSARPQQLAGALRLLMAAVKRQTVSSPPQPQLATEFLADSYYEQSRAHRDKSLNAALASAQAAVSLSPNFGFAWERVAELEFSFGRLKPALTALDRSLQLAPRNAQTLALKGFILSAQNDPHEAITWFDRAIAVDAALGNAWLGRGLARIRIRDAQGGREDLLMAAALEPQRAELRSYLGKAYISAGDDEHATKELNLAKKLDPNDPTAWLYSALQKQQDNQINDAIRDLEKSQSLNDNRSVYRSQLLLDQDNAVRSADLAGIYGDAGLSDVSVREAGRAVSYDYANYSAHLFLANSYDQLRDPNWSNLRYETPAVSEFRIAQLLAPASAGVLSSATAQQPYTKLFDQNRVGVTSDTTYLSRGAWIESGSQFGTYDNFSYSLDAYYITDNGQRVNNDNEQRSLSLTIKDQITPQDTVFGTIQQVKISRGDLNEYYDQANGAPDIRINETQQPNFYVGYHHEWGPGSHTLFYAARIVGYESVLASNAVQFLGGDVGGAFVGVRTLAVNEKVRFKGEINSTELQQILEQPGHTTILGTRFQWGKQQYQNYEWNPDDPDGYLNNFFSDYQNDGMSVLTQDFTANFYHYTAYGYHTWQIADPFSVTVGLDYDWLHKPADVSTTPFSPQEQAVVQFSPKAGFIWQPWEKTTLRGAYTHSISGFINGQSTRIEPTEVAGLNQAYRSLAPEAVAGDASGSKFDTFDLSLEQKFATGTYLALSGELLYSKLNNLAGNFVFYGDQTSTNNFPTYPDGFNQTTDFHEQSLIFSVDQLLGKQWSAGAIYRLSRAKLGLNFTDIQAANLFVAEPPFQASQNLNSVLNTVNLHANWNHPSGLFALFTADWYHQHNSGFTPGEPGDDFWQCNAYAGWRLWKRRVEFTVGLLNLFDQNYSLEPLNLYNETARSRTFVTSLRISF